MFNQHIVVCQEKKSIYCGFNTNKTEIQMQLDQNPFFRKAITPWYDSNFACWTLIFIMIFVFAFAIAGVFVSSANPNFHEHVWFPGFLAFLSLFLVIKIFFRLKRRSKNN
jgi:hypothetical protein